MKRLDIGVAGAGVAGLAAGALLARAGHRVTLFDRLEAPAPVGSGLILQPVGRAVLADLGCADAIEARGAPIARLFGKSGRHVVLDVRYAALGAAQGLGVHRGALFDVLHGAARAQQLDIEAGRFVADAPVQSDGRRRLVFGDGKSAGPFDLVLDCLGVRSELSRPGPPLAYGALWANVAWRDGFLSNALEQRYWCASKMAGVLPIGGGQAAYFWSLRGADHAAWRGLPLDLWKDEARALWPDTAPLLDQLTHHDDLVYARYAHRTLASPIAQSLAHVGDSYHCASPQLGQGANMALLDAYALAQALERQDDLALALTEYARMRALHVWLYQAASHLFTPVYQSDSVALPWFRDAAMGPISKIWPAPQILAAMVAGVLGAPLGAIGGPGRY